METDSKLEIFDATWYMIRYREQKVCKEQGKGQSFSYESSRTASLGK